MVLKLPAASPAPRSASAAAAADGRQHRRRYRAQRTLRPLCGVFRAWCDVAAVPMRRSQRQQPNPPPLSRSFFACLSQLPRFLSFCQRQGAPLRSPAPAACRARSMHANSAAAAISGRFHPQRMPLSSAPTAASATALQHIRVAHVFAHAARASRPLRLPPQLLPSAAGILHRARGILFYSGQQPPRASRAQPHHRNRKSLLGG